MVDETRDVPQLQITVNRITRTPPPPTTYAAFVFATQVGAEVQLDLCTMDFAEVHAKVQSLPAERRGDPIQVDAAVYHSVVIPEDAARVLHDTLTRAIGIWDRARGAGEGR